VVIQLPPEEVETTLGHHEDQRGEVITEIETKTHEHDEINTEAIKTKEGELTKALTDLQEWELKASGGPGSEGSTSFQKSGFAECTATPPQGQPGPSAGC
jgi:hypothetical protein